jgi:amino acid transporter
MADAGTDQESTPPLAPSGELIEVELVQGLGLAEALSIGVGTMIGAGIFVLPGFIISRAGPAAVISFLLGGIVALFCAMSAAEVATGMPKSGGGYYMISRALGPVWGAIIGWGSWFGLIFATAFYAIGFGEYVHAFTGVSAMSLGVGMTILLGVLNLVGAKAASSLQNLIVAALVLIMVLFVGRAAPATSIGYLSEGFAPFGVGAIFGGTATLFVTYCGFGEVASMAEEIKNPGRNLPRALLGSVVAVTVLYCVVVLICVLLRPVEELGSATIVADLATDLMGPIGGAAILGGAVLATVSSANASIMSASRISFAMGRDKMMWDALNEVHPRFRVPHRAVAATSLLVLLVLLLGDIELLAEAAGLLHLMMYGLICVACIILRGARPGAYRPSYRVPWFPVIPLVGALGTLVISLFMAPVILAMSGGLIAFALAHYWFFARRHTEVQGAWPYFLRRSVLEPAMRHVEEWGAHADDIPTAVLAVRNPELERAHLEIAAALMGPSKGHVLAINVFVAAPEEMTEETLEAHRRTSESREQALQQALAPVERAGATVTSRVPIGVSVTQAIVSAAEISDASLLMLGWPGPGPGQRPPTEFVDQLDRSVRSHIMLLHETGPVPANDILVIVDDSDNARLALLLAARLAVAWNASLTLEAVLPPDASVEDIVAAEADLEARHGDTVRATFGATTAENIPAAVQAAEAHHQMVVLGVPDDRRGGLQPLMHELESVTNCSVIVVRAHASRPIERWM